ncbi:GntR family transcriptional regulator [Rhizobiaceae bacterium BDR2-2]|uniref:GntR family transcriptional regulator n=1 Tax=Ectorhizobium quercum TaxID=2965071 RepID=A0AAE3SWH1_9HYPH|nr:GntR family transcriptional regulator [Ectorhizobium quercum]MCX8997435.1 GntR family transcriptional regulator [Ectorhizobium quercum]
MKSAGERVTEAKDDSGAHSGSLVQLAYSTVLAKILDGSLAGNQLISEGKLASDLGLSRTPMREAIGRLEGEGLVVRNGRSLAVQTLTLSDYLEIHHMRRLLETEAVALAVEHLAPEALQDLRQAVLGMEETVSPVDHWTLDDRIHNMIAEASGSRLLARTIADLRRRTRLFDRSRIPSRFHPGRQEHLRMIDTLLAKDKAGAVEAMRIHLDGAKNAILNEFNKFG